MGCAPACAFGVKYPEATSSMVLWWPVGGAKYRIKGQQRFAEHIAFVEEHSLAEVVAHVQREGKPFGADPRGGPWASVIKSDADFAAEYAKLDPAQYKLTVMRMRDRLLDRDTAPGADAEDLLELQVPALVVPGHDESHATSAARYLEECLPKSEYWDVHPDAQNAQNAPERVMRFLESATALA